VPDVKSRGSLLRTPIAAALRIRGRVVEVRGAGGIRNHMAIRVGKQKRKTVREPPFRLHQQPVIRGRPAVIGTNNVVIAEVG